LGADVTRLQAENDSLQAQLEAQHRSLSQIKAHAQMLERQNAKLARWHLPSHLRRLGLGKIKKD
jgi:cell division protein FtsB